MDGTENRTFGSKGEKAQKNSSMNQEPSIAIIVLNWNGFDDTCQCLESLRHVSYANRKIVLVDNGSTNKEGARLQKLFPEVVLIQNSTNRGFAGGSNDGITWAREHGFEYVALLNNDCIVEPSWLGRLVRGAHQSQADFASSRIMYYPETDLVCSLGDRLLPDGSGQATGSFRRYMGQDDIVQIFSASGAAALYSIRCLEAVQIKEGEFFDELYFAYFEDIDLGMRLNAKSFKGVCVTDAVVTHRSTRSVGYHSRFQLFHLEKNRMLNELLNFPPWLIPFGELWHLLRICVRIGKRFRSKSSSRRTGVEPRASLRARCEVFFSARAWICAHVREVLQDRRRREARGLLDRKVYRHFSWNISG